MWVKHQISQQVFDNSHTDSFTLDQAMQQWWIDLRPNSGLRLTKSGYQAFVQHGLPHHSFDMPVALPRTAKFLLLLDRKLDCPYYMSLTKQPQISLFGSEQAVLFALYGDLEKWMLFLSNK